MIIKFTKDIFTKCELSKIRTTTTRMVDISVLIGYGYDDENKCLISYKRYEHGHRLTDRKVYVLGNGCIPVQYIAEVARQIKTSIYGEEKPAVYSESLRELVGDLSISVPFVVYHRSKLVSQCFPSNTKMNTVFDAFAKRKFSFNSMFELGISAVADGRVIEFKQKVTVEYSVV